MRSGVRASAARSSRHQPQQDRSRRTENRILRAVHALSARRSYAALSVGEIARRAGVSVGGFYRRFPSKDSLTVHIATLALSRDLLQRAEHELSDERVASLSLLDVLRRYYTLVAAAFAEHCEVLRAVVTLSRSQPDSALAGQVREFNRVVHGRLREVVLARAREVRHPEPLVAFEVGLLAASAALREVVLFGQPVSSLATGSIAKLVAEVSYAHYALLRRR